MNNMNNIKKRLIIATKNFIISRKNLQRINTKKSIFFENLEKDSKFAEIKR